MANYSEFYDLRKIHVTYYMKAVIFYCVRSGKLDYWLQDQHILDSIHADEDNYVDCDPCFTANIDTDYDSKQAGVSRHSFCTSYLPWIQHCTLQRKIPLSASQNWLVVSLCFALALVARRALSVASHLQTLNLDSFLHGLYSLFQGDIRINAPMDEWIFCDMDLLAKVIYPGVRMSLKLYQDHFLSSDDDGNYVKLYKDIEDFDANLVIAHERDPRWRAAILANVNSLLALRHIVDDAGDEYKIIMLNKRFLSFRVIKVNKECVRGLWAGQLQELIFLRNRNAERGSIQNAKQALRNMINSSCDQPIGYPIFVSPLLTSYMETNSQLTSILGGFISLSSVKKAITDTCLRLLERCGAGCSSGGANRPCVGVLPRGTDSDRKESCGGTNTSSSSGSGRLTVEEPVVVPRAARSLHNAGPLALRYVLTSENCIMDMLVLNHHYLTWPSSKIKNLSKPAGWHDWRPKSGMEGILIFKWTSCHPNPRYRSYLDENILLLKLPGPRYVSVSESSTKEIVKDVKEVTADDETYEV